MESRPVSEAEITEIERQKQLQREREVSRDEVGEIDWQKRLADADVDAAPLRYKVALCSPDDLEVTLNRMVADGYPMLSLHLLPPLPHLLKVTFCAVFELASSEEPHARRPENQPFGV